MQKGQKCVPYKIKFRFGDYSNCLEATQLKNKINHPEKYETDVDSLKKSNKELIKSNNLILEGQQIFNCKRHYFFTKEINKISLSFK